jgi:hypothetical protein
VPLGDQVEAFADNHMGQQVGDGECYALADEALRAAGAKSAPDFGKITAHADYKWGTHVNLLDAQPGDVLQFRNHQIKITTVTKTIEPDGSTRTHSTVETHNRGHHTAVVKQNNGDGTFDIFEQHVKGPDGKVASWVQENVLQVSSDKTTTKNRSTKVTPNGVAGTVEEETTVTVTVTGRIWVYRPQAQ